MSCRFKMYKLTWAVMLESLLKMVSSVQRHEICFDGLMLLFMLLQYFIYHWFSMINIWILVCDVWMGDDLCPYGGVTPEVTTDIPSPYGFLLFFIVLIALTTQFDCRVILWDAQSKKPTAISADCQRSACRINENKPTNQQKHSRLMQ